ncbi:prolyl oligopeptidase family serine peptidase, partial [Pseudomonadota bacterium]
VPYQVSAQSTEDSVVCYEGLIPKFYVNEIDREVHYFSYKAVNAESKCEGEYGNVEYRFVQNNLLVPSDVNVEIPIISSPMVVSKRVSKDVLSNPESHLSSETYRYYKGPFHFNPFVDDVWFPSAKLINELNVMPEWGSINSTATVELGENGFVTNVDKKTEWGELLGSINQYDVLDGSFMRKWEIRGHRTITAQEPVLTSNHCWMLKPFANENFVFDVLESNPNLSIVTLNGGVSKYYCSKPGLYGPVLQAAEFQNLYSGECTINSSDCIDNALRVGVDFAAHSPSVDTLEVLYQSGFSNNSLKEKKLDGVLKYAVFKRDIEIDEVFGEVVEYPKIRRHTEYDLTVNCSSERSAETGIYQDESDGFGGWISNLSLSKEKDYLFFIAMDQLGNDRSINNLYVANMDAIRSPEFNCREEAINLTRKFGFKYPILQYKVDSENRVVSLFFEQQGETVVRFYRLGKVKQENSGDASSEVERHSLVYEYPHDLRSLGKIYDVVSPGFHKTYLNDSVLYVFHSTLNTPIGISRCYLRNRRYICSKSSSKIHQSSARSTTRVIAEKFNAVNPAELSTVKIGKLSVDRTIPSSNLNKVPTQVLIPSNPERTKTAIVSIHGGPNESWDGTFHQREYMLARLGYTVFLPNPAGSTGFGWGYTNEGTKNWGTTIYFDIADVIRKVNSLGFEKLFVMGFSFGGYMANWIQVSPFAEDIRYVIKGFIGVSGLMDLRRFANSTDQLWFPEWHLGCSKNCPKIQDIVDEDHPLKSQNPERYKESLGVRGIPALFISGTRDQRVLFASNVPHMLKTYRDECAPYSFLIEKNKFHGFNSYGAFLQGSYISKWITELEGCKDGSEKWNLQCTTENQHMLREALGYDGEVFDNLVRYDGPKPLHLSLKDLEPTNLSSPECQ